MKLGSMDARLKKWLLVMLAFPKIIFGQNDDLNLVSNPGFETYFECPVHLSHDVSAGDTIIPHWVSPTNGSVDYYNACSNSFKSDTGDNWISYLQPHSGNGCIGLLLNDEVREYIQTQLKTTLKSGFRYNLSFYIKRASKTNFASDAVDFYLSREANEVGDYENLKVKPTGLKSLKPNDDWQLVSIDFTASGGEKYLTLGNTASWHKNILIDSKIRKKYNLCYYFIDDVELKVLADNGATIDLVNNCFYQPDFTNLVWNGGFEFINVYLPPLSPEKQYANSAIGPFWYASGASSADFIYNPIGSDSLYYNTLEKDIFARVLYRNMPYLGRGMGGIIPFRHKNDSIDDYYEYLIGTLKQPLEAGKFYNVSFMVKSAPFTAFALNRMGLVFSDTFPSRTNYHKIERQSDIGINREQEIGSEEGWVKVSGIYEAKGGEVFFTIGAVDEKPVTYFDNQIDQRYTSKGSKNFKLQYPYYFVDDIVVHESASEIKKLVSSNPKNIVILIDASYSMDETGYLDKIKEAIRELTLYLSFEDQISVVIFGSKSEILIENFSAKNLAAIENKISEISIKGKSPYTKGLNLVGQVLELNKDQNVTDYVLVFTDGNFPQNNTSRYYDYFERSGVKLFPILIGSNLSNKEAFQEASKRTGGFVIIPESKNLVSTLLSIFSGND